MFLTRVTEAGFSPTWTLQPSALGGFEVIGLKQLASLLAGAIVLFGTVLVPAGEEGAVAIESASGGTTRALADQPVTIDLGEIPVYDLVTSRGAPTPPTTVDGGFETVRFLTSATDGSSTARFGAEKVPIPAGSQVVVEGLSGSLDVRSADAGVSLVLTGTAETLEVQPPQAPPVETYAGAHSAIPVTNVTLAGDPVEGTVQQAGQLNDISFTILPPGETGDDPPTIADGQDTLPFRQSARVRVADFLGLFALVEADDDHVRLQLDGFGNVTVLDQTIDREIHQDVAIGPGTDVNEPPEANFTYGPTSPEVGETVRFHSHSSDDIVIRSWHWDFDDGETSEAQHPEHAFDARGAHDVTLTVTDALGRTDTETKTVTVVNSRPIVQMKINPMPPVEGQKAFFEAQAEDRNGDITEYEWTFPNGTKIFGEKVQHVFDRHGDREVRLVVQDEEGATGEATRTLNVLNQPPTPSFELDPSQPTAREKTFLRSTSTDYGDGEIVNHTWRISDVGVRHGEVVKFSFPRDGQQTVRLTVQDDDGNVSHVNQSVQVLNAPPDVSIDIHPSIPNPGESTDFVASVTDDDQITEALWTFSDGTTRDGLKVTNSFAEGGSYEVTLVVTDADGATTTANRTFQVNQEPEAEIGLVDQPSTGEIAVQTSELFTVSARMDDPDGNVTGHVWAVNGNPPQEVKECTLAPDGNTSRLQCGWPDDDQHLIQLRVRDDDGATASTETTVVVLNRPPTLNPDIITDVVNEGETVSLSANPSDPDGQIDDVSWRVDGEPVGSGPEITHKFQEAGNRTVEVRATDDDGAVGTANFTVEVNARPDASYTYSPSDPMAGEAISFSANAVDPDGPDANLTYKWDFDDGTTETGSDAVHAYTSGGTYKVHLTVTDDAGASSVVTQSVTVDIPDLNADLDRTPTQPQSGDGVTFDVDVNSEREIQSIDWNFGDGTSTTTGQGVDSVTHSYSETRIYQVRLTIHADEGETADLSTSVRVTGTEEFQVLLTPQLPNGQCVNADDSSVDFQGENLATGVKIGLETGDATWIQATECTMEYTFPPGTWSGDDQFVATLGVGATSTSQAFFLDEDDRLLEGNLRLSQVPVSFENLELLSPGQNSDSENDTYRDPTKPVFLTGQARWADGSLVRDYGVSLDVTYRGPQLIEGQGITYHESQVRIDQDGTMNVSIPAPILGVQADATGGPAGPDLAYLPGQYRVTSTIQSGLYSDIQSRSFIEDPVGIVDELTGGG